MSGIAGFVQAYIKPSRWWRRQRTVQLTLWPRWLAQAVCPHIHKQLWMYDVPGKTITSQCLDCHKNVTEQNDCAHGEVTVAAWGDPTSSKLGPWKKGMPMAPATLWRCSHCGVTLNRNEMPKDVIIHQPEKQ